jgi:hypothetical protein
MAKKRGISFTRRAPEYITADLFVGATEEDIRQVSRLGVFNERQLSRMNDAALFTETVLAIKDGIQTASRSKLDNIYKTNEEEFLGETDYKNQIGRAIDQIVRLEPIHNGPLMKPYSFYTLMLAVTNFQEPVDSLCAVYRPTRIGIADVDIALSNLSMLADALEGSDLDDEDAQPTGETEDVEAATEPRPFAKFIEACSEATNTKKQREERFRWLSRALEPQLLRG